MLRTDDMRDASLGAWLLPLAYPLHIGVWKVGATGSVVVRVLYVSLGLAPPRTARYGLAQLPDAS